MATARPFAYNTGAPIAGTDQVGALAVGTPTVGFTATGLEWWNGPDEDLGYVIAQSVPSDTQPTPLTLTWDPNYIGTGIVLTSGNTVATLGQIQSSVLGTRLISSPNKVMYSIRVNQLVNGQIGFGLQDMDLNSYVGGYDAKSIGFASNGDYLYAGAVQDSGLPTWGSVNDVVDIALDLNNGLWWIRVNGGNWNGTRNENPAAGTGSVNSAALNNLYPAITPYPVNIQGQVTLLAQPVYSVPAGFTFLGEINASVGFFRSEVPTEASFIDLADIIAGPSGGGPFSSGTGAKAWLNANGYWTSYTDTYRYDSGNNLPWPASSAGYTLYNGGFNSFDDGYSISPITLPVTFETNNQASNQLYLSTNGYFTIGSGDTNILLGPTNSNPATMAANPGDNWLQPGLTNTDGDVQNWYYKTGTDSGEKYYVKNLVYAGTYGATTTPTSYVINFYRDSVYEWLETRVKSNTRGKAGPYNSTDVSQNSSTVSRVWRGDLNGQNWVYLGTGTVVP